MTRDKSNVRIYLMCNDCNFAFELPPISRKLYNMGKLFNHNFTCRACSSNNIAKINKDQYKNLRAKYFEKQYNRTVCLLSTGGDK